MIKKIVLDASALLALLQNEQGCEQIEKNLLNAVMSSVNFSEVVAVLIQAGIGSNEARELVSDMIPEIIPFDEDQAYLAATLRKSTKNFGLSLGDRACLALAMNKKALVFTADKIWSKLRLPELTIEVIR